jgi:RNA polymerase sigma factor (sigma-70 family)
VEKSVRIADSPSGTGVLTEAAGEGSREVVPGHGKFRLERGGALVATEALSPSDDGAGYADETLVDLVPMLRRVIGARVKDPHTVDDLVQETLVRVMAARSRIEPDKLPHYASVTARNLVASMAEKNDRARSRSHLLVDTLDEESPATDILRQEERAIVSSALAQLSDGDRDLLLAHEVRGEDTITMAAGQGSTPGAVAARLSRARASLRVEYLLVAEGIEPPTDRCRPVLRALSSGDRRRQRELDASKHLLGCAACARIRNALFERREEQTSEGVVRVPVLRDADVVAARQKGREVAALAGFSATEQTLIATAISEITRNIVKFAERGEVVVALVSTDDRRGVTVVAQDVGPGIDDPAQAMEDGYSTYDGLGLGLPGAKRLMDRLDLESIPGEGTTVTMEKWLP